MKKIPESELPTSLENTIENGLALLFKNYRTVQLVYYHGLNTHVGKVLSKKN